MDIFPKEGVGKYRFTMHRKEIVSILGVPDFVRINELVIPGVFVDEYRKAGLEFFYDFRSDLNPFCIAAMKRSKSTLLGDLLFDRPFSHIKTEFFEKHDLTCVFFGKNHIRVDELLVEFDYYGFKLNDETKIKSLLVFREGEENLILSRQSEKLPILLSADEMKDRYAEFHKF
jgi:hypothetical protein